MDESSAQMQLTWRKSEQLRVHERLRKDDYELLNSHISMSLNSNILNSNILHLFVTAGYFQEYHGSIVVLKTHFSMKIKHLL